MKMKPQGVKAVITPGMTARRNCQATVSIRHDILDLKRVRNELKSLDEIEQRLSKKIREFMASHSANHISDRTGNNTLAVLQPGSTSRIDSERLRLMHPKIAEAFTVKTLYDRLVLPDLPMDVFVDPVGDIRARVLGE